MTAKYGELLIRDNFSVVRTSRQSVETQIVTALYAIQLSR